jgi:hypothetical protein
MKHHPPLLPGVIILALTGLCPLRAAGTSEPSLAWTHAVETPTPASDGQNAEHVRMEPDALALLGAGLLALSFLSCRRP